MKQFTTFTRAVALTLIGTAGVGIVTMNMADAPVVASDYLVRTKLVSTELPEAATSASAEVSTLSDWEYTLVTRPIRCRFIN